MWIIAPRMAGPNRNVNASPFIWSAFIDFIMFESFVTREAMWYSGVKKPVSLA